MPIVVSISKFDRLGSPKVSRPLLVVTGSARLHLDLHMIESWDCRVTIALTRIPASVSHHMEQFNALITETQTRYTRESQVGTCHAAKTLD